MKNSAEAKIVVVLVFLSEKMELQVYIFHLMQRSEEMIMQSFIIMSLTSYIK